MIDKITDRIVRVRLEKDEHKLFVTRVTFSIIIGLLLINVLILNYILFVKIQSTPLVSNEAKSLPVKTQSVSPTAVSIQPPTPTVITAPAGGNTTSSYTPDELFIPLGTGVSQSVEWENVPGAQAVIDFGQYPQRKEVKFEASIYVPSANQYVMVRLFNVTDNNPVWNSEMTMNNGTTALLISNPLGVGTGSKLYQVQMRTQLQAIANLVQSRVRIISK